MEERKKQIQNYSEKPGGRYLKLGELENVYRGCELAGVVVHDEVEAFDEAVNEEATDKYGWNIKSIKSGSRFGVRVVLKDKLSGTD